MRRENHRREKDHLRKTARRESITRREKELLENSEKGKSQEGRKNTAGKQREGKALRGWEKQHLWTGTRGIQRTNLMVLIREQTPPQLQSSEVNNDATFTERERNG